jgi:tRNA (guanine-N1)-methyltransferase
VVELSKLEALTLLCGRYEGIDERIIENDVDREVSIGDYVISGGENCQVLTDNSDFLIPRAITPSSVIAPNISGNSVMTSKRIITKEEYF